MTPDNPFADLVTTAERLTEVLSHEVALLQAMKPRAIAALREEKDGLINSYEAQARALHSAPDALRELDPEVRSEIRVAVDALHSITRENERALRAAKDVNERMVQTIVEAVQAQTGQAPVYDPQGRMDANVGSGSTVSQGLSVNREL